MPADKPQRTLLHAVALEPDFAQSREIAAQSTE